MDEARNGWFAARLNRSAQKYPCNTEPTIAVIVIVHLAGCQSSALYAWPCRVAIF
jgi:hypothetical protein